MKLTTSKCERWGLIPLELKLLSKNLCIISNELYNVPFLYKMLRLKSNPAIKQSIIISKARIMHGYAMIRRDTYKSIHIFLFRIHEGYLLNMAG